MMPYCPHRRNRYDKDKKNAQFDTDEPPFCLVASELAMVYANPTKEQCMACTKHPTSPQRINGIVCAVAKKAQVESGLEPDSKLTICIHTEQTLEPQVLEFLRNKWKLLHSFKLDPWDKSKAMAFFYDWKKDIPIFGCPSCANHFDKILEEHPIRFDDQENYFLSTWSVHNLVNKRLYKEQFPLDEARKLWNSANT